MTDDCRILLVRLGSLGDIVHALPVASRLRQRFPKARLDWIVDERNREILDLVPVVDRRIVLRTQSRSGWLSAPEAVRALRRERYDVALDLQGLLKSALLARASGARRILGFPSDSLRERAARFLYTETCGQGESPHVVDKNLAMTTLLGASGGDKRFPLEVPTSSVPTDIRRRLGLADAGRYAVVNPGAAWPNKRWSPARFGAVAKWLRDHHALPSAVVWGSGEQELASRVAEASGGAAVLAPPTSIGDLIAVLQQATLMLSADTGPLHLAAAVGTPVVGIYGPTDPARNGPWSSDDVTVSRFVQCRCHHRRRCRAATWCLGEIETAEVVAAMERRMQTLTTHA